MNVRTFFADYAIFFLNESTTFHKACGLFEAALIWNFYLKLHSIFQRLYHILLAIIKLVIIMPLKLILSIQIYISRYNQITSFSI